MEIPIQLKRSKERNNDTCQLEDTPNGMVITEVEWVHSWVQLIIVDTLHAAYKSEHRVICIQ